MPSAVISAVAPARASISEQAYQHLRSLIIEGELAPGAVVAERRLAEAMRASRTPLRAAINRLEGEGLVERQVNGSIVIHSVSIDELLTILFVATCSSKPATPVSAEMRLKGRIPLPS
jgi:DNA-binding GntR family transcriptional regulator